MKKLMGKIMGLAVVAAVSLAVMGCANPASGGEAVFVPNTMVKITGTTEIPDFYISNSELTYARWYEVYQWATSDERGENKYVFEDLGREGSEGKDGAEPTENSKQPVTNVSWRDAIIWCNAASEMENLTPYYYEEGTTDFTDKTKVVRFAENNGDRNFPGTNTENKNIAVGGSGTADKAVCNTASNGYRLPTEKEWKYAEGGENFKYSGSDTIDEVAWYKENSKNKTHDVGTKKPNKYGLNDMNGNVNELCWGCDDYVDYGGYMCPLYGGSFLYDASQCYFSSSMLASPGSLSICYGFRVVRTVINNQ